jgi:hypothetical protein
MSDQRLQPSLAETPNQLLIQFFNAKRIRWSGIYSVPFSKYQATAATLETVVYLMDVIVPVIQKDEMIKDT